MIIEMERLICKSSQRESLSLSLHLQTLISELCLLLLIAITMVLSSMMNFLESLGEILNLIA